MKWRSGRSPAVGGWAFPVDPHLSAKAAPALWRPKYLPTTVIIVGGDTADASPDLRSDALFAAALVDVTREDGRHLLLGNDQGTHQLWIPNDGVDQPASVLLQLDHGFDIRADAARRYLRFWMGKPPGAPCKPYRLTSIERSRLILALRAFDGRTSGATVRDVGETLLGTPTQGRVWAESSTLTRTKRLIQLGTRLVAGDYLRLLNPFALSTQATTLMVPRIKNRPSVL